MQQLQYSFLRYYLVVKTLKFEANGMMQLEYTCSL